MVTGDAYLAGEDDDFVDRPGGFILQELADDETAKGASSDDSKNFVPRHVGRCYSGGTNVGSPVPLFIPFFKFTWAHPPLLTKRHERIAKRIGPSGCGPRGQLLRT